MKTRLILRADVPALGEVGDVVEVAPGYGRNYLVPLGLAYPYSDNAIRLVEKDRKIVAERRLAMMKEFEALRARLHGQQITFEEKVSEEGHLYGSVNAHRIATALHAQGLDVNERAIRLAEPLRAIGEFDVPIHVHGDMEAIIKVWVVAAPAAGA